MTKERLEFLAELLKLSIESFEKDHGVKVGGYSDCCGCSDIVLDMRPEVQVEGEFLYTDVGKYEG